MITQLKFYTLKQATLFLALSISILPLSSFVNRTNDVYPAADAANKVSSITGLSLQPEPGAEKMTAVAFRSQDFCRVELKDFEFDVNFELVSATVYFSGTNFRTVETGIINSKNLKPIKKYMDRCAPGSIVIFDNVKVIGPDKMVRTILGTTIMLH